VHIAGVYARTAQHVFVLSVDAEKGKKKTSLRPVLVAAGQAAAQKLR